MLACRREDANGISQRKVASEFRDLEQCGRLTFIRRTEEAETVATEIERRLQNLGIVLPGLPAPGGNFVPAKTVGSVVYLSGVISTNAEGVITGTVGLDRTVDEGYGAARACALTQLAVLKRHLGSLDAVKAVVGVNGYVNAVAGFADSPKVINGVSDLLVEVLGEAGHHVRAAIGVSALPRNALVEVQMTVEIER
jgi:enamine deaminase RidA (YjgF/YER057c/UK114 family)